MRHHSPYVCPIRTTEKKRGIFVRKVITYSIVCGFILASLIYDANSPILALNSTNISGNSVLPTEKLKETVNTEIDGKYLWVFPKNNYLLYPRLQIKNTLLSKFPTIKKINISASLGNSLSVSVEERKPFAVWCDGLEKEECYFLDDSGFVYSEAPDFSGSAYFKYYGFINDNPVGKIYGSSESFAKINSFVNSLKKINIMPMSLRVDEENDVFVKVSPSGEVILNLNGDLKTSFENLQSVLNSLDTGIKVATSTKYKFDYIDLRFGDKVFVR